jgi:putative methionine-R-sulfoxide reductase with GAF domain
MGSIGKKTRDFGGFDLSALLLGGSSAALLSIALFSLARGSVGLPVRDQIALCVLLGAILLITLTQLVLRFWEKIARKNDTQKSTLPSRLSTQPLDYLVSLLNVSRAVSVGVSLDELCQVIVDSCRDCFDSDEVSLMMLEPGSEQLSMKAFAGHRDVSLVRNARMTLGQGVAGTVAKNRTPIILGCDVDARRFPGFQAKTRRITSSMIAPIVVRNRVVGVLNASTSHPTKTYTEDDLRVLCILAEHAGIAAAKSRDTERVSRIIRRFRRRARHYELETSERRVA